MTMQFRVEYLGQHPGGGGCSFGGCGVTCDATLARDQLKCRPVYIAVSFHSRAG